MSTESDSRFDSETGRAAALSRWAHEPNPAAATAPAAAGFLRRFERLVDPDDQLTPAERDRRARRLMTSHMILLARRSRAKRTR